ncbi:unnamed protein product [Peronospora belbahrii]|uniref:PHD-type domain-containing protein n=1 Tax=Peronospora belbahrii TaxID=622444 RepID=A0AAU9LD45_9STRA|nr:unnamed protein product [Peronospora belbahrii]
MPATASKSSLVTRTRVDHASSLNASPGRPFRVGSDGLPLLPCHNAPVRVISTSEPILPAVAQFGHVDRAEDVRKQFEAFYSRTKQLEHMSEMTLRIDTELEILRRSCFAERNAQWQNVAPDQFEFQPVPSDVWTLQPPNDKLVLRKMKMEGVLDGSGKEFYPPDKTRHQETDVAEFVRDRPWPPREFALKPLVKASRGRGGKRKATPMGAVLDPVPLLAKMCRECKTQSTPLWRTQTRTIKVKKMMTDVGVNLTNAFGVQSVTKTIPQTTGGKMQEVEEEIEVDLCLQCYLRLERADLFDKKSVEKMKGERRKKDQAASAAVQEKKRLKQQIYLLKKQQKQETKAAQQMMDNDQVTANVPEDVADSAAVILKFTRKEIEAATGTAKEKKKVRKHSRKDKKKKKKNRRKREQMEDSESDSPTTFPSPAQMNGYVYADRALDSYASPHVSAREVNQADPIRQKAVIVETEPEVVDDGLYDLPKEEPSTAARSSSRKRKSVQRTEPVLSVELPVSTLKKRKTSLSRTSRPNRAVTSTAVLATAVTPSASSIKKRSRTKKELAHERELRARGQYCPVCNEVYEDDDQNTFVCCDSCELWVHGACDPSLTQEIIATMANSEEKYICPLCNGSIGYTITLRDSPPPLIDDVACIEIAHVYSSLAPLLLYGHTSQRISKMVSYKQQYESIQAEKAQLNEKIDMLEKVVQELGGVLPNDEEILVQAKQVEAPVVRDREDEKARNLVTTGK